MNTKLNIKIGQHWQLRDKALVGIIEEEVKPADGTTPLRQYRMRITGPGATFDQEEFVDEYGRNFRAILGKPQEDSPLDLIELLQDAAD